MYIGIDPGLQGAIAFISSDGVMTRSDVMPLVGGKLDLRALLQVLKSHDEPTLVVIEQVGAMPGQGVCSMFTFGKVCGAIEAILVCLGYRHQLVTPQTWQKVMHAGISRDIKPKDRSLITAKRLFPGETFLASERCRKPHDGIVDALLLAEYGRRMFR